MTLEETHQELSKYLEALDKYKLSKENIECFRMQLYGGKGVSFDSVGKKETKDNITEIKNQALADYETELQKLMNQVISERKYVLSLINTVSSLAQRKVLAYLYIQGKSIKEIAQASNYSYKRILQIRNLALKNISLNFPEFP